MSAVFSSLHLPKRRERRGDPAVKTMKIVSTTHRDLFDLWSLLVIDDASRIVATVDVTAPLFPLGHFTAIDKLVVESYIDFVASRKGWTLSFERAYSELAKLHSVTDIRFWRSIITLTAPGSVFVERFSEIRAEMMKGAPPFWYISDIGNIGEYHESELKARSFTICSEERVDSDWMAGGSSRGFAIGIIDRMMRQ